jgi:F-type H+-transporting ATPase subunit b
MLIDWFTTIAQMVNFIILLVVLKYLLYDRVLKAIDRRRDEIARQREQAEDAQQEAQREVEQYRERREELESGRAAFLREAHEEAERHRDELLTEARTEVDRREEEWRLALESEKERLVDQIATEAGLSALAVAERVLGDLADESRGASLVSTFAERVQGLNKEERARLAAAIRQEGDGVVVRISPPLAAAERARVSELVEEGLGASVSRFEVDPDLVWGIRLAAGGRIVGWSVRDYLDGLTTLLTSQLSHTDRGGQ